MNTQPGQSSLVTLWQQQRNAILRLGQTLHERIPSGNPEVTVHGRDLDTETEGIGFQFQYTINGHLYGGQFRAAYFVVQAQLTKRKAGLGWIIDAMPVLEIAHDNYDLYMKRTHQFAYRDRQGLESVFLNELILDATTFFSNVREGRTPRETATPHGGQRTAPLL